MAPAYKVTYFNVQGLGESIRFLLSYGGIEFEDKRVEQKDWPDLKPQTPFGKLPVLEHNGKIAHQSIAICRYLAKQVKLVGKDDWQNLEIDAVVDTINEMIQKIVLYCFEEDEKTKESKTELFFNETLPHYLERFDAQIKKNNGYFIAGQLTWADIYFVAPLDHLNFMLKRDIFGDYPNIQTLKRNVLSIPNIRAWIEKRPKIY